MSNDPQAGWRLSTHLFIAWSILLAGGAIYDLVGPERFDDAGNQTNGIWAGRAAIVWLVTLLALGVYRGVTSRQERETSPHSHLDELAKLGALRAEGVLNEAEFEIEKDKLLGDSAAR